MVWPFFKGFIDTLVRPTPDPITGLTGYMVRTGMSADLIAITGAIPWAVPVITVFVAVYIIIKPESPPDERMPPNE